MKLLLHLMSTYTIQNLYRKNTGIFEITKFMSFMWWCTIQVYLNKLGPSRRASRVCLRAVLAVVVSGRYFVSHSVAAVNGGSVAEDRALSRLTDQEHEVSTWCSLDIVSVISKLPPIMWLRTGNGSVFNTGLTSLRNHVTNEKTTVDVHIVI